MLRLFAEDEHGVAISMKAKKEGITPQEVIDKYDGIISKSFADFGISFDNYSRTSSKIHHDTASSFLENYTIKATLLKKLPSNYMMRKLISFWQTVL
jgi:methionyl-tRNA synthetase